MQQIRVLLVDDHTIFREGLREIINAQSDMTVVGEAKDGVGAVKRADELTPDIVLMDIKMPTLDGVAAARLITAHDEQVGVIILTMYLEDEYVLEAIRAGAKGYILKDADLDELLKAVRSVHRGEPIIDPSIASRALVELLKPTRGQERPESPALSKREEEILRLVAEGATNKQIADSLFLSKNTVRNVLGIIFQKLHVKNRTEAVVYALREGWLKLE